jgi:uroporphyrinogen III methyltransferase/synthase
LPGDCSREMDKLKGKTVLVTRPANRADAVTARLRRAGAKVIHIPLIEIADPSDNFKSLDRAIAQLEKYDWVIFTSQNGVEKFFARCRKLFPLPLRERVRVRGRVAAVGPATAAALKKHGIRKVIIPRKNNYSADGLIGVLKKYELKGKRVLFPSAKKARETLPFWLKRRGARLTKAQAYQTVMPKKVDRVRLRKLIREDKSDFVMFHSESAEKNFWKIVRRRD